MESFLQVGTDAVPAGGRRLEGEVSAFRGVGSREDMPLVDLKGESLMVLSDLVPTRSGTISSLRTIARIARFLAPT